MQQSARSKESGRKRFFFEKKKQKTFDSLGPRRLQRQDANKTKVFWFFFSKKNVLPSLSFLRPTTRR